MQREAKTTQAQTSAEFRRTEKNKGMDEAKKITKLSPVPSEPSPGQHHCWLYHETRNRARCQILWKDGYSSQVLSLHQITVFPQYFYFFFFSWFLFNFPCFIVLKPVSLCKHPTSKNYFLTPQRESHKQIRQRFPVHFCTEEAVPLPQRLPFSLLNIPI